MNVAIEQADNITLDHWSLPGLEMQRQDWEVPPREQWRVETKFRQVSSRSKACTLFRRFNGHFLAIQTHRRKKALPEQVVDLTFVEPRPRVVKDQRYPLWFAAACLMIIPAVTYSLVPVPPLWFLAPLVLALGLALAAAGLRKHHVDFLALNSDVVLFRLDARGADPVQLQAFVDSLCAGVAAGQNQLPEGKRRVPLAVAEMRRLAEQGVITREQYETVKRNWFLL